MLVRRRSTVVLGTFAAAVMLLAFILLSARLLSGRSTSSVRSAAVELLGGVPVGVEDSPAGALAAADEYLAASSQTLEQAPAVFGELVRRDYAPAVRARVLSEARQIRASDPQNIANYARGGRGLAVIAARRLDSYTAQAVTVTSWLEGIVWGPHLTPRQTWNLIDTTLSWQHGRWLVLDEHLDATPAPVPAVVYVQGTSDTAGAFGRLDGMSRPIYGAEE